MIIKGLTKCYFKIYFISKYSYTQIYILKTGEIQDLTKLEYNIYTEDVFQFFSRSQCSVELHA